MDDRISGQARIDARIDAGANAGATTGWCALAGGVAAGMCGVPSISVAGRNRTGARQRARRLALHLSHVGLGLSLSRCAVAFGRDRAAARRACARIEEGRERPAWDRALDGLERALRVWRAAFSRVAGAGR